MTVFANGRSILHKGHGKTQLAVAPDVCKTPSPGGPVPIPYPNMSADSNLTDGAATVLIQGNPLANTEAKLSRCRRRTWARSDGQQAASTSSQKAKAWCECSTPVLPTAMPTTTPA